MPKELFNQPLLTGNDVPDDNDRIAFGQPSVSGGKNTLWSRFKEIINTIVTSLGVTITDPATESIGGTATKQSQVNEETVSSILQLRNALTLISGAFVSVDGDPQPQTVTTTEEILTFSVDIESTNTDIIEVDDTLETITIKEAGIYQFTTFLDVSNAAVALQRTLTLRTRKNDINGDIITERDIPIDADGYSSTSSPPAINVLEADLPLTLVITKESSDIDDLTINIFNTNLFTGARIVNEGGTSIISYLTNVAIRAITSYADNYDAFNLITGNWYKYDSTETELDDDDIYLTPDDITEPDPGRWVKKQRILKLGDTDYIPLDISNNNYVLESGFKYSLSGADGAPTFLIPDSIGSDYWVEIQIANSIDNDITIDGGIWTIETEATYVLSDVDNRKILRLWFSADDGEVKVEVLNSEGGGNIESVEKDPFTETIEISNLLQHSPKYTQTGDLTFARGNTTFINGEYNVVIEANGSSFIFNTTDFVVLTNDYANKVPGDYLVCFKLIKLDGINDIIAVIIKAFAADAIAPQISGYSGNGLNEYVDIDFSEPVYGANDGSTPVALADLLITNFVSGVATSCFINSITKVDDQPLTGGESSIRCQLTFTGVPNGTETFEIQPTNGSSIYDKSGNAMLSTETTGTITTVDTPNLLVDEYNISGLTIPNQQTITVVDEFTIFVMADTPDGDPSTPDGDPSTLDALVGWDNNSNYHLRTPGVFRVKLNNTILGDTSTVFNDGVNSEKIFAFTYSKSNNLVEVLADNVSVFSSFPLASFDKTNLAFYWGGNISGYSDWNGNIYAVRVYDKQLSPTELTNIYNELDALRP